MQKSWFPAALLAMLAASLPGAAFAQDSGAPPLDESEPFGIEVQGERWLEPDEVLASLRKLTAPDRRSRALPRFYSPFCPRVAGVDKAVAQTMEQRIRENAKFAGLFTEPKRCRLNAFVIVLEQPLKMFDRLRNRRPGLLGSNAYRDKHVRTIRLDLMAGKPVVAWNQVSMGWPGIDMATPDFNLSAQYSVFGYGVGPSRANFSFANTPWGVGQAPLMKDIAVVLLDKNQLGGFDVTQIADFASLYLIGVPRRDIDFTGVSAPTMLKMFEDGPENAPRSLTEFDRAYLKGISALDRNTWGDRIGTKVVAVYRQECARPGGRCDREAQD